MSNRSLIEFNHDFTSEIGTEAFIAALRRYLNSADRERAGELERFGDRVLGMRHHSGSYVMDGTPDGFPPQYLTKAKAPTVAVQVGQDVLVLNERGDEAVVLVGRSLSDPQPANQCRRRDGCVCGGDTARVRAGCGHWRGDD